MIGKDRTGSGKTLSYALPLTEKLRMNVQSIKLKTSEALKIIQ